MTTGRVIPLTALLLAGVFSASGQNLGSPPHPLLDASEIYSAFALPMTYSPGRPPADQEAQTQVGTRAQKLGLTTASAGAAWTAAQALLAAPAQIPTAAVIVTPFTGSTASALNAVLKLSPNGYIRVTSATIGVDQPIEIAGQGLTLDLGAAQLTSATSQPYMIRIDGGQNITVTGGSFTSGNSAILVSKAAGVTIDGIQISGLTGDGVVITGSNHVTVAHSRITGLAGPGIVLNGGATACTVMQNDISNNLGESNWDAAIMVSDRDVDLATDPHSIFDSGGYWPIFSPVQSRLNPPHDNLLAFNHIAINTTSGIYMDGGVRNIVYANTILGNAKEGLCLDNGATADVVVSNTIQQNGNRWGQSDATLTLDFVDSRLPDGTAAAKLPGISIDNGIFNFIYGNNISHNSGDGVKMVRTGFFNVIGLNTIENDNDGGSVYFRFFGVELGAALGDAPSAELDFTPSRGNIVFSNLIRGSNSSGIFIEGASDQNQIFDNVIKDATAFAIESEAQIQNFSCLSRELRVLRQVEVAAVGDPLELRPADGEQVFDVAGARGVVRELVGVGCAQAQVVGADAKFDVPALALGQPVLEPLLRIRGRHEELHLHLLRTRACGR